MHIILSIMIVIALSAVPYNTMGVPLIMLCCVLCIICCTLQLVRDLQKHPLLSATFLLMLICPGHVHLLLVLGCTCMRYHGQMEATLSPDKQPLLLRYLDYKLRHCIQW